MMRKLILLIALFIYVTLYCGGVMSCTYDYFVDETNYIVFVPEVADNSVDDCRVIVYRADGTLVRERHVSRPWGNNPREKAGLFAFHLNPGDYKVYCYTNTEGVAFNGQAHLDNAYFALNPHEEKPDTYVHPSDVRFHILAPTIVHPGVLITDTVAIANYTGRITVRFKNLPANVAEIDRVKLKAVNVATVQYLKTDTLTTRFTSSDTMSHLSALRAFSGNVFEVDHRFLPTVDDEERVYLEYTFLGAMQTELIRIPIPLADRLTGNPIRLLHGQRIIIEVDTYVVTHIAVVGWDEDIQSGEVNIG